MPHFFCPTTNEVKIYHLQTREIRKQQKSVWSGQKIGVVQTKNSRGTNIFHFFAELGLNIVLFFKQSAFYTKLTHIK